MDFKVEDAAWIGSICQKFETLCSEETFKYVENQLQAVGSNVGLFCSEFVQEVLTASSMDSMEGAGPDLSLEKNKSTDLAAYERSNEIVNRDSRKGFCNINSLSHTSFVEPVEVVHSDSSLKQNADFGMYKKLNKYIKRNSSGVKQSNSKVLELVAPAEKDSSTESSFYEVNQSNHEEGMDAQDDMLTSILVEVQGCKFSTGAGKSNNIVNALADTSSVLPSASSVILVQTCEGKVLDSGLTPPADALSAVLNDASAPYASESFKEFSWAGIEPCDEFSGLEDLVSLADSERSDDAVEEEARDDHVTGRGMETTCNELNLGDSCIVVDSNELCSISLTGAQCKSYEEKIQESFASKLNLEKEQKWKQQATCYEDVAAGAIQRRGTSFAPSTLDRKLESADQDFGDFDWEII